MQSEIPGGPVPQGGLTNSSIGTSEDCMWTHDMQKCLQVDAPACVLCTGYAEQVLALRKCPPGVKGEGREVCSLL